MYSVVGTVNVKKIAVFTLKNFGALLHLAV
jgi:hypothetical protein